MNKNNYVDTAILGFKNNSIKYFIRTKNNRGDNLLQH